MSNWKVYAPIEHVDVFDEFSANAPQPVSVVANCATGKLWPSSRIVVHHGQLSVAALTVEQSRELRGLLEQAERDVAAGVTTDPPEVTCG